MTSLSSLRLDRCSSRLGGDGRVGVRLAQALLHVISSPSKQQQERGTVQYGVKVGATEEIGQTGEGEETNLTGA
jgi:hypothetical protein